MFRKRTAPDDDEHERQLCVECGKPVDPRLCAIYKVPPKGLRTVTDMKLRGIYCDSDCLLDAYRRGAAFYRTQGQGK